MRSASSSRHHRFILESLPKIDTQRNESDPIFAGIFMYYFAHLALPAIVALIAAASGAHTELNLSWVGQTIEKFAEFYMILAAPHWIWAALSGYFDASKGVTVGGFTGLHLLLSSVWLLVALSEESHAANGWFIYFLCAPMLIVIGALTGRYIASRTSRQSV